MDDQVAHRRVFEHVGQQITDVQHLAKSLQDLDEPPVLALGEIGIDDIVVEEISTGAGRDREELVARAVHQNGAQRADFGGDVNWHAGRYRGREGF